jgi:hypothetical protein
MTSEIVGAVTPPLTERERRICGDLLALVVALTNQRLPLTLQLVGVDLEIGRREWVKAATAQESAE